MFRRLLRTRQGPSLFSTACDARTATAESFSSNTFKSTGGSVFVCDVGTRHHLKTREPCNDNHVILAYARTQTAVAPAAQKQINATTALARVAFLIGAKVLLTCGNSSSNSHAENGRQTKKTISEATQYLSSEAATMADLGERRRVLVAARPLRTLTGAADAARSQARQPRENP